MGLGDLPGGTFQSDATAVSADGTVVVGRSTSEAGHEGFRWKLGRGMVGLGDLPGGHYASSVTGVSSDGKVVVGGSHSSSGSEGFRWTRSGGMATCGTFSSGYFYSEALDVSADGNIIVGYSLGKQGQQAFIWDECHGMRDLRDVLVNSYDLDLDGWTLKMARAISDDGFTIVGKRVLRRNEQRLRSNHLLELR